MGEHRAGTEYPKQLTDCKVPESANHVFIPLMDLMNSADEIYGTMPPGAYIKMMDCIAAEATLRAANCRSWHDGKGDDGEED